MALLLHISIALSSIAYTTWVFFFPTRRRLYGGVSLVTLTLASGTYLVVSSGANILPSCLTGLVYTVAMTTALVSARLKLDRVKVNF